MKLTILIILQFFILDMFSQKIIVLDKNSNKPIQYATISYYKNQQLIFSSYSDELGSIILDSQIQNSTFTFSCTGYQLIEYKIIKEVDTIFLEQHVEMLPEIFIGKTNFTTVGCVKCKKKITLSAFSGFEMCTYIENNTGINKNIKSVLLKAKIGRSLKSAVRLHFYKIEKNKKMPGSEIITNNIVRFFNSKTNDIIKIDVSEENLVLPADGYFIGIEWIEIVSQQNKMSKSTKGVQIEMNDDFNELNTYLRNRLKNSDWQNTLKLKTDSNNSGLTNFKNYPNLSIGLEVFK